MQNGQRKLHIHFRNSVQADTPAPFRPPGGLPPFAPPNGMPPFRPNFVPPPFPPTFSPNSGNMGTPPPFRPPGMAYPPPVRPGLGNPHPGNPGQGGYGPPGGSRFVREVKTTKVFVGSISPGITDQTLEELLNVRRIIHE